MTGAGGDTVDLLVVGAGMAGLAATRRLLENESMKTHRILVVDKGRQVGGRMALRRRGTAAFDTGAQFFTARDPAFTSVVEQAAAAEAIRPWFTTRESLWRGVKGMTDLPKWLAAQIRSASGTMDSPVEISLNTRIAGIELDGDDPVQFLVRFVEDRPPIRAVAVIASPPVLQILDIAGPRLTRTLPNGIETIQYAPCLALLIELSQPAPPWLGEHGMARLPTHGVDSIVDNTTKGIAGDAISAWTVHFSGEISSRHYDREETAIVSALTAHIVDSLRTTYPDWARGSHGRAFLDEIEAAPASGHAWLKKWRYAKPLQTWPARFARSAEGTAPFYLVGDAFGGPRVEGAFLSGTDAAETLLQDLDSKAL